MNQLPRVIGKAPSEVTFSEFLPHLKAERKRTIDEIVAFQTPSNNMTYAAEVSQILKEFGVSPKQLEEMIRKKTGHDA